MNTDNLQKRLFSTVKQFDFKQKFKSEADYKIWLGDEHYAFKADVALLDTKSDDIAALFMIESEAGQAYPMRYYVKNRLCLFPCFTVSLSPNGILFAAKVKGDGKDDTGVDLEDVLNEFGQNSQNVTVTDVKSYLCAVERERANLNQAAGTRWHGKAKERKTIKTFFRGENKTCYHPCPSLFREIKGIGKSSSTFGPPTFFPEEEVLLQEAERIFPELFAACKSDLDRMAIAQHHKIPTRLLDITGNALVALYFAAELTDESGKSETDGKVYVFRASAEDYRKALSLGQMKNFNVHRYHVKRGAKRTMTDKPQLVFPVFSTLRQKAQDGSFYLFEYGADPATLSTLEEGSDFRTIIIPKGAKSSLLNELETLFNIHEGTLFPELLSSYSGKLRKEAENRIRVMRMEDLE